MAFETGVEPVTDWFGTNCSTSELFKNFPGEGNVFHTGEYMLIMRINQSFD